MHQKCPRRLRPSRLSLTKMPVRLFEILDTLGKFNQARLAVLTMQPKNSIRISDNLESLLEILFRLIGRLPAPSEQEKDYRMRIPNCTLYLPTALCRRYRCPKLAKHKRCQTPLTSQLILLQDPRPMHYS